MYEQTFWIKMISSGEERQTTIDNIFEWIRSNPKELFLKRNEKNEEEIVYNPFVLYTTFICHRINRKEELEYIPPIFGVEIDVRENQSTKNRFLLAHDPFKKGEDLDVYLESYRHALLIMNIKSTGIEPFCIGLMNRKKISEYFFLDSSFPMMVDLQSSFQNTRFATRISEYETTTSLPSDWIWIDSFHSFVIDETLYKTLSSNHKICIVSPELQKRPDDIPIFRDVMIKEKIVPDAICCKIYNIYKWI